MPYRVNGLRSWNINAEHFESAVRFYRDVLGAEETARHQVAGANVVRLKLGSTGLGVFDAKDGPRRGVPTIPLTLRARGIPTPWCRSWKPRASRWRTSVCTAVGLATPYTSTIPAATGSSSPPTRRRHHEK